MDDIKVLNLSNWTEYLFVRKTVLHWAPKSSLSFVVSKYFLPGIVCVYWINEKNEKYWFSN